MLMDQQQKIMDKLSKEEKNIFGQAIHIEKAHMNERDIKKNSVKDKRITSSIIATIEKAIR